MSDTSTGWRLSIRDALQRTNDVTKPGIIPVEDVSAADLGDWQAALREKLWDLLGGPGARVEPCIRVVMEAEEDGYTRSLLHYETEPGVVTSAWLLAPKSSANERLPGFLALHGHGRGKDDVLGMVVDGDPNSYEHVRRLNYDYAVHLVRRGYVVLAPDARGFGERASGGCHVPGLVSLYQGRSIAGQRLWDDMRSLDLLATLPMVDPRRLGCGGLSEGGKRSLFLAALDERVQVAVVSGYFTSLRTEIARWDRLAGWDICNVVPGLLRWADLPDVAALIAPRHLTIEIGRADPLYTLEGVVTGYARMASAWHALQVADRIDLDIFDGAHQWSGRRSYQHVDSVLRPE
ncbi:alpha/beta hydrolase family protein [Actinopolymorpha singaporensis]